MNQMHDSQAELEKRRTAHVAGGKPVFRMPNTVQERATPFTDLACKTSLPIEIKNRGLAPHEYQRRAFGYRPRLGRNRLGYAVLSNNLHA